MMAIPRRWPLAVRQVAISALLASLAGCGTIGNFFSGEDNSEPPAPLVEFEQTASIVTQWQQGIGDGSDGLYLKLTPALGGERLYGTSRDGDVVALNRDSGRVQWRRDTREPLSSAVGTGAGLVLVGSSTGWVVALEQDSGEERWKKRVSSEVLAAPQVAGNTVVVRSVDGKLTGLNAETGNQQWTSDRGVPALSLRGNSSPAIYSGYVIAGFDNGRLLAIEPEAGRPVWETRVAIGSGRSELDRMVDIDADPVIQNDIIYVTAYQGRLAAVSTEGGRVLWDRDIPSHAGLALDSDNIYVTDDRGHIWALEQVSGASIWKNEDLQARATSAPAVVGPYLAVGDVEGYVHWLERSSGEFVARTRVDESPIISAPISADDSVIFYSSDGRLTAYTYK